MAISAYVGVPGSGKSYEVVKSVLLPAYLAGRRIVTNIEGINEENFREYALSRKKAKIDDLGVIIRVSDSDVMQDNFFPFKVLDESLNVETVCKAGDLIAIDELWRIWGSDSKIPDNHRSFIAEHRHFTDDKTGLCCDLVVINQAVTNLPRFLKDRIETTYRMSKHVALGLKSRYRVDVFNGIKLFKSSKITSYQEKYQKDIFKLYKSYDGVNGQESTTDKRQNILSSKRIWFLAAFMLLMFLSSIFLVYRFFTSNQGAQTAKAQSYSITKNTSSITNQSANNLTSNDNYPVVSKTWRIAGTLKLNGKSFVILISNQNAIRLEPSIKFHYSGLMLEGLIDGEIVTRFTGRTGQ